MVKPAKSQILRYIFRMAEGAFDVFVFRLCAADEKIDLEIFPVKPFHFVFYDAVLKKYLLCRRAMCLGAK